MKLINYGTYNMKELLNLLRTSESENEYVAIAKGKYNLPTTLQEFKTYLKYNK